MSNDEFKKELITLLNTYSKENGSETPDFILAEMVIGCIDAFDKTTNKRDEYYNIEHFRSGVKLLK